MKKLLLALVVLGACGDTSFAAVTTFNSFMHYFRHNGTNYDRNFTLAGADRPVEYGSDAADTCPSTHKTRGNRNYTHMHINHTMPQNTMINGVQVAVTAAMVGAFWDTEYAGYGGIPGGQDMTHNCHGHCLKSNTFIAPFASGMGRWNADYVWSAGTGSDKGLDGWCAEINSNHGIRSKYQQLTCTIASVQTPVNKIVETSEKFYDSTVYTKTGGSCTVNIGLKDKFLYPNTDIGAYTTHVDCQMCHQ